MEVRFDGIKLYYNSEKVITERLQVKISYLTALIFIDGEHVTSYYAEGLDVEFIAKLLMDDINGHGVELNKEEATAIAKYIKEYIH